MIVSQKKDAQKLLRSNAGTYTNTSFVIIPRNTPSAYHRSAVAEQDCSSSREMCIRSWKTAGGQCLPASFVD